MILDSATDLGLTTTGEQNCLGPAALGDWGSADPRQTARNSAASHRDETFRTRNHSVEQASEQQVHELDARQRDNEETHTFLVSADVAVACEHTTWRRHVDSVKDATGTSCPFSSSGAPQQTCCMN